MSTARTIYAVFAPANSLEVIDGWKIARQWAWDQ
jgi:hypothetical protein